MKGDIQIFATGTMRGGGSLLQNMLSVHTDITMLAGFILFFRFYYQKYEPLNEKSIEKMIGELSIRLKYRKGFEIDKDVIIDYIFSNELTYANCYRSIINELKSQTEKKYLGEYVTLGWRDIPVFLELFPKAKIIHMCRDPRAILSSFSRITNMPDNLYLNSIFNWIDSVNHIQKYKNSLPKNRYKVIKFEDIHNDPNKVSKELCQFLEIDFQEQMLEPEKWNDLFDKKFVDANISAYSKKKVFGFDVKRTEKWKESIDQEDLNIIEYLAIDQMNSMDYQPVLSSYDDRVLSNGLRKVREQKILNKNLKHFLESGEGTDLAPNDPTDPKNWDAPGDAFTKFTEHEIYEKYLADYAELNLSLETKYQ